MLYTFLTWALVATAPMNELETTCKQLDEASRTLAERTAPERMAELEDLALWIAQQSAEAPAQLVFICTHNSRRSHMGQIWAQTAAQFYGLDGVRTFSGGTEVTAFNPRAVQALRAMGVGLEPVAQGPAENPRYAVRLLDPAFETLAFSKHFGDPTNPASGFAAVMTCSEADGACPIVFGSAARFSLPYIDPKSSDGTPQEPQVYAERARQIGAEMFYVMRRAAALRKP